MPEITCDHCGSVTTVDSLKPGQPIRCRQCGSTAYAPESPESPGSPGAPGAPGAPFAPNFNQASTSQETPGIAIGALICAIVGFCFTPLAIVGLILGIISLNKIAASQSSGRGLAIAAVTISTISIIIGAVFIFAGIMLPALGAARRTARQMQNSTQVRGIHQALIISAQGNNSYFPGIDRDGNIVNPDVESRYDMLLSANHFGGEYAISPSEEGAKVPWTAGPVDSSMYSYSMLQLTPDGERIKEWRQTNNGLAPVISDRLIADDLGYRSVHTAADSDEWRGSIAWNDNHVSFEPDFVVDTVYGDKIFSGDDLFEPGGNDDAWMVYTGNGE